MTDGLEDILAFMPEAVVAVGDDQHIVYINASAERCFGYNANDLIGQRLDILIPRAARAQHRDRVANFEHNGPRAAFMHGQREVAAQRADGTVFPAEATIVRGKWQGRTATFAILRDVTEQHMRQSALAASEKKYRAILEGSPEAILIADPETGRLTEANAAAARLFACDVKDLIGLHQTELHPEEMREKFRQTFREHIDEGRITVPDGVIKKANGDIALVEISASPVSYGNEQRLVGFFRDVTERERQRRELQHALSTATAAIEAKRMFLANMSHELRTPLNAIIGFADLIRHEIHGKHSHVEYREYGEVIHKSGHHLLDIVNDILDLSRIEAGKYRLEREEVNLAELVDEVLLMLSTLIVEARLVVEKEISANVTVNADRRALKQMLINLLSNAIKFSDRYGHIEISATMAESGAVIISVRDSGVGIPEERLALIVEPFASDNIYSKEKGGAGIGLSITKRLVDLHGGDLKVVSKPGRGSTFSLVFPAISRNAA